MKSRLIVPDIPISMHLGVSEEEKSEKQMVAIHLEFFFLSPPAGCQNDSIEDTVNYALLAEKTESICLRKKYSLIEHLAKEIHQEIKREYKIPLKVKVHKFKPPHRLLSNGATFVYGDEI